MPVPMIILGFERARRPRVPYAEVRQARWPFGTMAQLYGRDDTAGLGISTKPSNAWRVRSGSIGQIRIPLAAVRTQGRPHEDARARGGPYIALARENDSRGSGLARHLDLSRLTVADVRRRLPAKTCESAIARSAIATITGRGLAPLPPDQVVLERARHI